MIGIKPTLMPAIDITAKMANSLTQVCPPLSGSQRTWLNCLLWQNQASTAATAVSQTFSVGSATRWTIHSSSTRGTGGVGTGATTSCHKMDNSFFFNPLAYPDARPVL